MEIKGNFDNLNPSQIISSPIFAYTTVFFSYFIISLKNKMGFSNMVLRI